MTAKGDCKRIKAKVEQMKRDIRANLQATLSKVGEDAIAEARLSGNYQNPTGNLRNSIGYAVVRNGKKVDGHSNGTAEPIEKEGTDRKASEKGYKKHVKQMMIDEKGQMQLIVVAGMEYGFFVETKRGRNVLQSAKTMVEKTVPEEIEDLKNLIIEKFNN